MPQQETIQPNSRHHISSVAIEHFKSFGPNSEIFLKPSFNVICGPNGTGKSNTLDAIIFALDTVGRVSPPVRAKAELARIGRYYATESMLVLDPETGRYDAEATPSTGSDTLFDYYERLLGGEETAERGEHAVF